MDIDLIQDILNISGSGLKNINSAANIAERLKALFKSSQGTTDPEIKSLIADLTMQIADTKLANADLKIKLAQLLEAAQAEKSNKAKLAGYALKKTNASGFVYVPEGLETDHEQFHMICTNCYEDGVRSILQRKGRHGHCPKCSAEVSIEPMSVGLV